MKKQKEIKEEIMNIVSVPPEREGETGYLKLTDEEIDKMVGLGEQIYQEGFEAGQHEATPQYKKDMEDAYEKGRKDTREEIVGKLKEIQQLADKEQALETDLALQGLLTSIKEKKENL